MAKKFVVKLRKGGPSGNVVATSQVITIKGLGDTAPVTSDFKDGALGGVIKTNDGQACFVKTIAAPDWTLIPVSDDCATGQCIIKGTGTIHYNWTTSLAGVTDRVRWRAVFPNTTTLFTGGGLDASSGTIETHGYSGSFAIVTVPIKTTQQFQVALYTDSDNGILLARSRTCTILPAELTINGPATAISNQPIPAVFKGYANDTVTFSGPTNGSIKLDNYGQQVVDLTAGKRIEPGVYRWKATGILTPGTPEYALTIVDMFGRIEYPKDGKDGKDGTDGSPGVNAVPGVPGTSAVPGIPGTSGTDGTPGSDSPIIVVNATPGGTSPTVTVTDNKTTVETTTKGPITVKNTKITFPTDSGFTDSFKEFYLNASGQRVPGQVDIEFTFDNRLSRTVYAKIVNLTTTDADFESVAVQNLTTDIATVTIRAKDDKTTEGAETFRIELYTDLNGNAFYQSQAISLIDNSVPDIAAAPATENEYKFKILPEDAEGKLEKTYNHTETIDTKFQDGPPGATYTIKKSYSPPVGYATGSLLAKVNLAGTVRGQRAIEITELYYKYFSSEPPKAKMTEFLNKVFKDKIAISGTTTSIDSIIKSEAAAANPSPSQTGTLDSNGYAAVTLVDVNQLSAPGTYIYDVTLSNFIGTVTNSPERRYTVIVAPKQYDMTIEPKGSTIDRYEQPVTQPITIKISGGPPGANIEGKSSASVSGWGGPISLQLDTNGAWSGSGTFGAKGTYTYAIQLVGETYLGILKNRDQSTTSIDSRNYIVTVTDGAAGAKTKYDPIFEVIHGPESGLSSITAGDNEIRTLEKFGVRIRGGVPKGKADYTISSDNGTFSPSKNFGEIEFDENGVFATPTDAHVDQPGTYTYNVTFKDYGDSVEFNNGPTRKLDVKAVNAPEFKVTPTQLSGKIGDIANFTFSGPAEANFSVEEVTPAPGHKNPYMVIYHEAYDEFIKDNPGKDIESAEAQAYSEKHYTKDPTDKLSPARVRRLIDDPYLAYNPECDDAWAKSGKSQAVSDYLKTFHATQETSLKSKNGFYHNPDAAKNRQSGGDKQSNRITKSLPTNSLNRDGVLKSEWDTSKENARLLPYAYRAKSGTKIVPFRYTLKRSDMTEKEPDAEPPTAAPDPGGLKLDNQSQLVVYRRKPQTELNIKITGSSEENVTMQYYHPGSMLNGGITLKIIMNTDATFPDTKLRGTKAGIAVNESPGVGGGSGPTCIIDEAKYALNMTKWGHMSKDPTTLVAAGFPKGPIGVEGDPRLAGIGYQFVGIHYNKTNKTVQIMFGIKKGSSGEQKSYPIILGVDETGRFWQTFIPPTDKTNKKVWVSADVPVSVIDVYTGKSGLDPLELKDLIEAKKAFTLNIKGGVVTQSPLPVGNALNSKFMHPYLHIYPDAMAEWKKNPSKTPTKAAIDHYAAVGKNNPNYIEPNRLLALIATPYFNFYPEVEKEYNDAKKANATGTTAFSYSMADAFAATHYKTKGKLKINPKWMSPVPETGQTQSEVQKYWDSLFDATQKAGNKLDKETKSYDLRIPKIGGIPATIPYTFRFDGDKSDNVVTALLFVETAPVASQTAAATTSVTTTAAATTTTQPPEAVTPAKVQPAPLKSIKVTPSSITTKEDVPVMMTFEGEPNDQLYVEYFDPKIPDVETYIEYNLDLYNEWQANSKTYIAAGYTLQSISDAHYANHGKAEGRRSPAEALALDKIWRANGGKRNAYIKLPSSGKLEVDISSGGREALRHRRLPYSWKVTGDTSVGSAVASVTVTQPALKKVTATAKAAEKLLKVTDFFQDGTGNNILFYIGDSNETTLPTSVKVTVLESNMAAIKVGAVVFDYPTQVSTGSIISTSIYNDESGNRMGGRINSSVANGYGVVIKLRITVVSAGGTWTSSATSTPSDLVYHGGTFNEAG